MGFLDSGSFGINLGISPGEWFGEDRPDEQRAQNYENQKEFAKNSVQWRVADAKAAGLHPLFGAGLGSTSYSPNPVTVSDSTSVGISPGQAAESRQRQQQQPLSETEKQRAAIEERAQNDSHARTLSAIATDTAQQDLLRAQTDYTQWQMFDSQAARAKQMMEANKERAVTEPTPTNPVDAVEVKPREQVSRSAANPALSASHPSGPPPGWDEIQISPGVTAIIPQGQSWGDMDGVVALGVLSANLARYGWHWWDKSAKALQHISHEVKAEAMRLYRNRRESSPVFNANPW